MAVKLNVAPGTVGAVPPLVCADADEAAVAPKLNAGFVVEELADAEKLNPP